MYMVTKEKKKNHVHRKFFPVSLEVQVFYTCCCKTSKTSQYVSGHNRPKTICTYIKI